MPNPGDYEATFGSAEQQELYRLRPAIERLTRRVQEREAVIETMAQEKEALRREVATLREERRAVWAALGDVHGTMATTLPDAVKALVKAYNRKAQ